MRFGDRPTEITPWWPCQCGGKYALGFLDGKPTVQHTVPTCPRYDALDTDGSVVRFSKENRKALTS